MYSYTGNFLFFVVKRALFAHAKNMLSLTKTERLFTLIRGIEEYHPLWIKTKIMNSVIFNRMSAVGTVFGGTLLYTQ